MTRSPSMLERDAAPLTADERAAALLAAWPPNLAYMFPGFDSALAFTIRAAEMAAEEAATARERERAARVAEGRQRFHDEQCLNPRECRCADGYHVAMEIRKGGPL